MLFCFCSSRRRHTSCALVTGVQTCALPISSDLAARGLDAAPQSYASDNLWNYEAGAKTQWFDRALTVNVASYKIRWKNPQVTAQLGCGFNVYVNAGGLDIEGLEFETILRPAEGLSLRGGVGYTDSRLTDDLEFVGGASGSSAPFIPRWTLTEIGRASCRERGGQEV